MPIGSGLSFLGIAKEATPGTAVAATNYIPVTDFKPKIIPIYIPDEGIRASQAKTYNEVQGPTYAEYGFSGAAYPDSVGWALAGLLNDVVTTGASAPFSHALSLLNSGALPTAYTLSDYNGFNTRQFAGLRFDSFTFKFAGNGLLEYDAHGIGRTFATTTKPTPAFTSIAQQAAWVGVSTVGGSASSLITQGDLTIKRSGEPIHNVDGAQSPYDVFVGSDLEVTGSLTAVYEDDTIYANYIAGTPVSLDFNWQQGASAALTQIKAHMTNVVLDDCQIDRSQGKYVELAIKFTATANSTDVGASGGFSPIKVTLQNALASGTYK